MRNAICLMLLGCAVLGDLPVRGDEAPESQRVVLSVDVTDGSLLIAQSALRHLAFKTSVGDIDLPLRDTKSIVRRADGETFSISLRNGDALTGAM